MTARQNYAREPGIAVNFDSLGHQMDLYDSLPADIKALYDQAPVPIDLRQFHAAIARFGPKARDTIEMCIRQDFPAWKPIIAKRNRKRS